MSVFFFKQKTAYEIYQCDWSSDVCSSDLTAMLSPETEMLLPRIPLHRFGRPADVAGAIYYLCSEDAAYVTATEIMVTGGQHVF